MGSCQEAVCIHFNRVESGVKAWDDSIARLEQQILMPFPLKRFTWSEHSGKRQNGSTANVNKKGGEKLWY